MKNNIVSVRLWGHEICLLEWRGGYKPRFGKLGAVVSFNPDFHHLGLDPDPLGPYSLSKYIVQKGLSDLCRATEYDGLPGYLQDLPYAASSGRSDRPDVPEGGIQLPFRSMR